MDKVILKEFVIPFKGISKKTIYHFSDSHLTEYDEKSDENEIAHSKKQTAAWEGVRRGFCERLTVSLKCRPRRSIWRTF